MIRARIFGAERCSSWHGPTVLTEHVMLDTLPYSSPLTWASLIQLYSYVKYDYGDYHSILILFIEGPTISTKAEGRGTLKTLGLRVEDEPLLDFTLNFARYILYDETMSRGYVIRF